MILHSLMECHLGIDAGLMELSWRFPSRAPSGALSLKTRGSQYADSLGRCGTETRPKIPKTKPRTRTHRVSQPEGPAPNSEPFEDRVGVMRHVSKRSVPDSRMKTMKAIYHVHPILICSSFAMLTSLAACGGSNQSTLTGQIGGSTGTGGVSTTGTATTGGASAGGGSGEKGGNVATGGARSGGGNVATGGAPATGGAASTSCAVPPAPPTLVGWGTGTTGGGSLTPVVVTTLSALNSQASGSTARVILVQGPVTITGDVTVGSNKTIVGTCGAIIHGHVEINSVSNVILRNITVQGNNCTDSPSDCSAGADAISVLHQTSQVWIDHCDIYDGSDGNLDITNGSDLVTVSWSKFHYTGRTDPANAYGHMFSNLVGGSDSNGSEDTGHLNVTWHHNWWATNVRERMPRVRFGKNHVFNNLYTSSGDQSGVAAGVNCNVRLENNVFVGLANPIDLGNSNAASILQSIGNVFTNCTGSTAGVGTAFVPTYPYTLDATSGLQAAVQSSAGPQ